MPVMTLYEEVENILTNRFKNALRTDEIVNAPDWVSDLAACLALAATMVEKEGSPGLQAFAHRERSLIKDSVGLKPSAVFLSANTSVRAGEGRS